MNARWLSLPLSARGLLRELTEVVDDNGLLETSLGEGPDDRAIGDELARLLCAFRGEYRRVRRDVAVLVERGFVVVEGSRIRVCVDDADGAPVCEVALKEDVFEAKGGSAKRMRDLRARRKVVQSDALHASRVTLGDVTRDASSDASDASPALSFDRNKMDLREEGARERHCDARGDARSDGRRDAERNGPSVRYCISRNTPFHDEARAIAIKVGVRDGQLAWFGFVAHFAGKKLEREWADLWQTWVARQATWDRARPETPTQSVDLKAPWLLAASGNVG